VVRRCVWSRNLKNEEAKTRVGPQRHRLKKSNTENTDEQDYKHNGVWRRVAW
jgi:hypothetical protein